MVGERGIKARVAQLTTLHETLFDITVQRDWTKLLQIIVSRAARLHGVRAVLCTCGMLKSRRAPWPNARERFR